MGGRAEKYTLESAVPLRYELMPNRPSGTSGCLPVDAYRRSHTRNAVNANTKTTSTHHLRGVVVGRAGREEERPHERDHADAEQHEADGVERERLARRMPRHGQEPDGEGDGGEREGHVDPEDAAPAVFGPADRDHEPAEGGAERGREADGRTEQAERPAPLLALEELLDEAEHLRHLDAGRDALHEPRDEQHGRVRRERGDAGS